MLINMLIGIAVFMSLSALPSEAIDKETVRKNLAGALLCKGDPLKTFRETVGIGSKVFSQGVAAYSWGWGGGLDEMGVIIIDGGISIAGAKANAVMMSFSSPLEDFNGFVFAEFEGDAGRVIRELKLQEFRPAEKNDVVIGRYVNPLPVDPKRFERGEVKELCPRTIALTPLSKGKFLLGCGWCPG
ncbi:MAG: hypothetical protein HZB31_08700 [Nitrospirae bacterium]|nr:hypothetical protein [Nitrospirota bacterium]